MFYQNLRYNWNTPGSNCLQISLLLALNGAMIRNHVIMSGLLYYFQLKDYFKFLSHLATTTLAHGMQTQICSWKQSATSFVLLQRLFLLGPGFLNLIPGFLRQICWVHRERKLNLQFSNFKLLLQSSTNKNSNPPHPVKIVTISQTWSVIRNQFISNKWL